MSILDALFVGRIFKRTKKHLLEIADELDESNKVRGHVVSCTTPLSGRLRNLLMQQKGRPDLSAASRPAIGNIRFANKRETSEDDIIMEGFSI